jgi:hypothetical protein
MLVIGPASFLVLSFLARHVGIGMTGTGVSIGLSLLLAGYMAAYMVKIIRETAGGDDEPPDWPDISNVYDDVLRPAILLLAAIAVSFWPVGAAYAATFYDPRFGGLVLWFLGVLGVLYFPMAMVTVVMHDSLQGLNPLTVLGGIAKTCSSYVMACAVLVMAFLVCIALEWGVRIPVPLLGELVQGIISFYFIIVEMRILGLIYRCHEHRLGWFE